MMGYPLVLYTFAAVPKPFESHADKPTNYFFENIMD
jgi:hypothetical protein